ncbi:TonB-dependent receptor [Betaproteobacteria bacterium GR16-43]|nr:TonB-dependent receptor [Betaproteobacteria bacterium GR16-43]
MKKLHFAVLLALASPVAFAQTPPATPSEKKDEAKPLESITVVGSRRTNASATDTPVPVDFLPINKVNETNPHFDLGQSLQYLSPSFNSTRQTGADGADLIDSAALRGLGSDQTLVLVNGKRRHTTALVNLFGARNRGNTGTDMNTIPMLAVDNVQILRDGASSQYGSDAIAGVMNIEFKKKLGCEGIVGYGQYSEGDGKNYLASAYCGIKVGEGGVLAVTAEYLDRGSSNRAEPGNPRTIGDTATQNATIYANGEVPVGPGSIYFTLGNQGRDASSGAFARGGIGSDDIPSRNSAAMYPNGFVPFINGDIDDRYGILGYKMPVAGWQMDLSQTYGFNRLRYNINKTLNASIAALDPNGLSPTQFDAGGFSFAQYTSNLDFTRYFPGVMGDGLNVAFGAEYRKEKYKIFAGEPGSYIDADGVGNGGNAGSQGFPGFQPADETDANRNSYAAYLDVEADVTSRLKVQAALRFEDYSDFGSTTTGKLAGLFKLDESFAFRGSVSSGFRAPSLQQAFFSSTFTDFISGVPLDVVLAPNGGAIARAAGIPDLKEEKSKSFTFGATWNPTPAVAVTADFYEIKIDDRIVLSGRFDADNYPALGGILQSLGVGQAQFFVNSVDTRTKGVDLTFSWKAQTGVGRLNTYVGYNYSKTEVTGIHAPPALAGFEDVLLSERERLFIEQGAPRSKAVIGFNLASGKLETDLKVIYFGEQTLGTFSGTEAGVPNAKYAAKTSADLAFTWSFTPNTRLTVGAANIFDKHPTEQDPNETDNGFKYDSVQFGLNGRSYFARLWTRF